MSHDVPKNSHLAVLIDAENISYRHAAQVFKEIAGLGAATARRIYGDWSRPHLSSWRGQVDHFGLFPVQLFQSTAGKNGADGALIIDAMDLLHSARFEGFCIVSSDGDFARLARRIRESGLLVFGFGETKAPPSFVKSCDHFFRLTVDEGDPAPPRLAATPPTPTKSNARLAKLAQDACKAATREDGWASLSAVGDQLLKLSPGFDPRSFGSKTLGGLVESIDLFELKKVPCARNSHASTWFIRAK